MTERSTRRAAETKLIDAAYHWYNAYINSLPSYAHTVLDLRDAVKAHVALGLEMPDQPAYSNNSTDTSAAAPVLGKIAGDARKCFDEILIRHNNGAVGLTADQVSVCTGLPHQTASARINGLRNSGWIIDSGQWRHTRSNRKAIVWKPSLAALMKEGFA